MPSNAKKTTKTTDKKVAAKKTTTAAKKAPAKKVAAKKPVAAKKTATTKTTAKKPAAKATTKAPAKKTATTAKATKAPAKKAVATKKPATKPAAKPAKKVEAKKEVAKKEVAKPEVKVEAKKANDTKKKVSTNTILGIVFGSIAAVAVVVAIIIIAINAGKSVTRNRQAGDLKFYLPASFVAEEPSVDEEGTTYSYTQGESLIGTSVMVGVYGEMDMDQALEAADVDSTYQITDKTIDGVTYKTADASLSIFGITMDTTCYITNQNGKTYLVVYLLVNPTSEDKDIKNKFENSLTFKDVKVEEVVTNTVA